MTYLVTGRHRATADLRRPWWLRTRTPATTAAYFSVLDGPPYAPGRAELVQAEDVRRVGEARSAGTHPHHEVARRAGVVTWPSRTGRPPAARPARAKTAVRR